MPRLMFPSVIACAVVAGLSLPVPAIAEMRGPYAATCGETWALRGLDLRAGSWIDAVRPLCIGSSTPNIEGAVDEKHVDPFFGGGGGGPHRLWCYKNTAVRGLMVNHGMVTDHTRAVVGLQLVCGSPDGRGGPIEQAYARYFNETKPRSVWTTLSCPPGLVATGIFGRSGQWLDQIGLVCDTPRVD